MHVRSGRCARWCRLAPGRAGSPISDGLKAMVAVFSSLHDVERLEATASEPVLPARSTLGLLRRSAAAHDGEALVFAPTVSGGAGDERYTYAELLRSVQQAANLFHRLGVGRHDVVSILLPNLPQAHFAIWGAQSVGIAHPVSAGLAPEAVAEVLRVAGTCVLVMLATAATPEFLRLLHHRLPRLRAVLGVGSAGPSSVPGVPSFDDLTREEADVLAPAIVEPSLDDVCALIQTGGTTGAPKLARHTHRNQVYQAAAVATWTGMGAWDTVLCGLPLTHPNGLLVTGLAPLHAGSRIVMLTEAGYRGTGVLPNFWRMVERYRANFFSAVPTVIARLADVPVDDSRLDTVRFALCGAAPLPATVMRRFEAQTGLKVLEGYGLTEGAGVSAANPADGQRKPGSVGLRLPFQQLRCARPSSVDGSWYEAGPGCVGHVQVKGPNVFAGYVGTGCDERVLCDDGWLDTGDLGSLDEDGYLWLAGRSRDLIIRGGLDIDPALIEEVIARHPAVAEAAAVARPDPERGEVPVVYVTLRPGVATTSEALMDHCRAASPGQWTVPERVRIVQALPSTILGKVHKATLRKAEACAALADAMRSAGVTVTVTPDPVAEAIDTYVVSNVPRGRRPTVDRVMATFALRWRYAGARARAPR